MLFNVAEKVAKYLETIYRWVCSQKLLKNAPSGHTVSYLLLLKCSMTIINNRWPPPMLFWVTKLETSNILEWNKNDISGFTGIAYQCSWIAYTYNMQYTCKYQYLKLHMPPIVHIVKNIFLNNILKM